MTPIQVVHTLDMEREEWLAYRQSGLGGSDIGSILGFNKWKSPMQVYLEKIGEHNEDINSEAAYWGNELEDLVAREYSKRTGYRVRRHNFLLQHPQYPFLQANVDRIIIDKERGNGVLECKTANEYTKKYWEDDEVPPSYYLQVQHYLGVTGLKWGAIAVLIGGQDFRIYPIERDEEIIETIIKEATFFWNEYVEQKKMPPADGSKATSDFLNNLYPETKENDIALPTDALALIEQYEQAKEQAAYFDEVKKEAENKLKALLGENEIGLLSDRTVSWKPYSSTRIDSKRLKEEMPEIYERYAKTSNSRRFLIK